MRDPQSIFLRYHQRGEMPSAREWNSMVYILERDENFPRRMVAGPFKGIPQDISQYYSLRHRLQSGDCDAFESVAISSAGSETVDPVMYTREFSPTGAIDSGGADVLINGMENLGETGEAGQGWASYAFTPVLAKFGTKPSLGGRCGPRGTSKFMEDSGSGFRYFAPAPNWGSAANLGWVVREPGIGIGSGTLSQEITADQFELDNVEFLQGINTASDSDTLEVHNPYADTFEAGLYCTFWWNGPKNRYEVANISCPTS